MADNPNQQIFKLLREKVVVKQEVFEKAQLAFNQMKSVLRKLFDEMQREVNAIGKPIPLEFLDKGNFQVEFTVGDDTLIFLLQTNIYTFESSHEMWKTTYVQEDNSRAFCGKIYVYNFLTDSFKYNRGNDLGMLIARIMINRDSHFFVEGKSQLNFLFNDFQHAVIDPDAMQKISNSILQYAMEQDPNSTPYEEITPLSVQQVIESSINTRIATGERLGFRFQTDTNAK